MDPHTDINKGKDLRDTVALSGGWRYRHPQSNGYNHGEVYLDDFTCKDLTFGGYTRSKP